MIATFHLLPGCAAQLIFQQYGIHVWIMRGAWYIRGVADTQTQDVPDALCERIQQHAHDRGCSMSASVCAAIERSNHVGNGNSVII